MLQRGKGSVCSVLTRAPPWLSSLIISNVLQRLLLLSDDFIASSPPGVIADASGEVPVASLPSFSPYHLLLGIILLTTFAMAFFIMSPHPHTVCAFFFFLKGVGVS